MNFHTLDTVVLERDFPEFALVRGDLGAVVHVYDDGCIDVEFVTASGRTGALVTLRPADVRPVADNDLVSVRPFHRAA